MSSPESPTLSKTHPIFWFTGHALLCVTLLLWPWIFVGHIWANRDRGGVRASPSVSALVQNHPHDVDFFVTTISYAIGFLMAYSYSRAIAIYYDNWYSPNPESRDEGSLDHQFFQYWRVPTIEWSLQVVWRTIIKNRQGLHLLAVLIFYMLIFVFIGSGLNAVLIPHAFTRTMSLEGNELDFTSTNATCVQWLADNPIPSTCNWIVSFVSMLLRPKC
jgi:hypothetical protein